MLVIEVKLNEKVMIGDDVEVQVTSIKKGRVKLSFDAPIEVVIRRIKKNVDDITIDSCMG